MPVAQFHKLRVKDIKRETSDCVSIGFHVPPDLKGDYKFIHGQYLTLKLNLNGKEIRRCYSICTSPVSENELRVAIKKVANGIVSTWLNDHLQEGVELDVLPPMGNFFTKLNPSNSKRYVLLAGGSGITPIISILKTALETELSSSVVLFYGSLNEQSIIFKDELVWLSEKYRNRLEVHHILDKPELEIDILNKGIMTIEKIKKLMELYVDKNNDNEYFLCGPPQMKNNVLKVFDELIIEKKNIHVESFTFSAADAPSVDGKDTIKVEGVARCVTTIILDGVETNLTLGKEENILQAALNAGLNAPFSCRGGMCSTCRAKVLEGKAAMKVNYALSDREVEQGYILSCQAYPITPGIVVNYDEAL